MRRKLGRVLLALSTAVLVLVQLVLLPVGLYVWVTGRSVMLPMLWWGLVIGTRRRSGGQRPSAETIVGMIGYHIVDASEIPDPDKWRHAWTGIHARIPFFMQLYRRNRQTTPPSVPPSDWEAAGRPVLPRTGPGGLSAGAANKEPEEG